MKGKKKILELCDYEITNILNTLQDAIDIEYGNCD